MKKNSEVDRSLKDVPKPKEISKVKALTGSLNGASKGPAQDECICDADTSLSLDTSTSSDGEQQGADKGSGATVLAEGKPSRKTKKLSKMSNGSAIALAGMPCMC